MFFAGLLIVFNSRDKNFSRSCIGIHSVYYFFKNYIFMPILIIPSITFISNTSYQADYSNDKNDFCFFRKNNILLNQSRSSYLCPLAPNGTFGRIVGSFRLCNLRKFHIYPSVVEKTPA